MRLVYYSWAFHVGVLVAHGIGLLLSFIASAFVPGFPTPLLLFTLLSFSVFVKLIRFEQQNSNRIATAYLLFNIAMSVVYALTGGTIIFFAVFALVNIIYMGVFDFYYCNKYCPDILYSFPSIYFMSPAGGWTWKLNQFDPRYKDERLFRF